MKLMYVKIKVTFTDTVTNYTYLRKWNGKTDLMAEIRKQFNFDANEICQAIDFEVIAFRKATLEDVMNLMNENLEVDAEEMVLECAV